MADLCRGSGATARPSFPPIVAMGGAALAAELFKHLDRDTADALGTIVAGATAALSSVCNGVAPDFPTITAADWLAVLNPVTGDLFLESQNKFVQWVTAYMWPLWCECNDGLAPGTSSPTPVPPVGQNTALPPGSSAPPCWQITKAVAFTGTPVATPPTNETLTWLPSTTSVTVTPQTTGFPTVAQQLPSGANSFTFSNSSTLQGTGTTTGAIDLTFFDTTGAQIGSVHPLAQDNVPAVPTTALPIPSNATSWTIAAHASAPSTWTVTLEITFSCASSPNVLSVPCCPPDPNIDQKLNQILQLVANLTFTAGNTPPTGWHDGVTHTGLRGAGSFTITPTAIGLRLVVTTPPTGVNVDPGNPDFYWDMGFITPYALTSPMRGIRLVFLNQSWAFPEFTDQIGYTLKHGTVINATELLPTTT